MAIEIEVDPHHATEGEAGNVAVEGAVEPDEQVIVPVGWTPEQAGQFICSIWNIGCIIYGPGWAADPRETQGWDMYCAQLLDQVLPRGMGGAVELGVGLVMVGNGLAMMTMRRWPIIKAGPRPIWVRENVAPQPQVVQQEAVAQAPAAEAPSSNGESYHLPYVKREVPEDPAAPWSTV